MLISQYFNSLSYKTKFQEISILKDHAKHLIRNFKLQLLANNF